jgi:hypothetical protein
VIPGGTPSPAVVTAALGALTVPERARAAGFAAGAIAAALS